MQVKLRFALFVIFGAFLGLCGRLAYYIVIHGEEFSNAVLNQSYIYSSTTPYKRGDITDRDGVILATDAANYNVVLDGTVIIPRLEEGDDPDAQSAYLTATADAVSSVFGVNKSELIDTIRERNTSQYIVAYKGADYDSVNKFKKLQAEDSNIKGVWFELEYKRVYPYERLASHVLGYTNAGNVGTYGIEQYYNDMLNGTNGRNYGYYDNELNLISKTIEPENGATVVSTIDSFCQAVVEDEIEKLLAQYKVMNIGVVVADPHSGEIYAMSSNHEYDLNNPRDLSYSFTPEELAKLAVDDEDGDSDTKTGAALNRMWRNFCISDTYEPGSTYKLITVAGALEENIVQPSESADYFCGGSLAVGKWNIRCANRSGHGQITLTQAVEFSCNVAMMIIGEKMGSAAFVKYQNLFNYGQKTGVDLPGEAPGILLNQESLGEAELATSTFGQSFNVSMMQMVAAYSSLVNGGYYYRPHVVSRVVNPSGITVYDAGDTLMKLTVSSETSEFLRHATEMVVKEGTGKRAAVEGYLVGGKTGTAQKGNREDHLFVVSFIASVPADNPKLVSYVVIDQIDDEVEYNTSHLATDLTSAILSRILPHMGIYPVEGEIDYKVGEFTDETNEGLDITEGTEGEDNADGAGTGDDGNAENNNGGDNNGNTDNGNTDNGNTDNGNTGDNNNNGNADNNTNNTGNN